MQKKATMLGCGRSLPYVNTYDNEEVVTINEQELNYSIFERKNDTNVPILSNVQHTSTYQVINNLVHGISI